MIGAHAYNSTDRQTDRQTEIWICRRTDRQAGRQTEYDKTKRIQNDTRPGPTAVERVQQGNSESECMTQGGNTLTAASGRLVRSIRAVLVQVAHSIVADTHTWTSVLGSLASWACVERIAPKTPSKGLERHQIKSSVSLV